MTLGKIGLYFHMSGSSHVKRAYSRIKVNAGLVHFHLAYQSAQSAVSPNFVFYSLVYTVALSNWAPIFTCQIQRGTEQGVLDLYLSLSVFACHLGTDQDSKIGRASCRERV